MGRVIVPIVVLLCFAGLVYGVYLIVTGIRDSRQRKRENQKLRDLAQFAPAVLDGSPLVDVVIAQGQQLGNAADLFKALMANEIHVFMPNSDRQRISDWITEYEKNRRSQS